MTDRELLLDARRLLLEGVDIKDKLLAELAQSRAETAEQRKTCDTLNRLAERLRKELAAKMDELHAIRGAMNAQNGREKCAGEKCGVDYNLSGCYWPDAVAEKVVFLRAELSAKMDEVERFRTALNKIASWGEGKEVSGRFDSPYEARVAREALKPKDPSNVPS